LRGRDAGELAGRKAKSARRNRFPRGTFPLFRTCPSGRTWSARDDRSRERILAELTHARAHGRARCRRFSKVENIADPPAADGTVLVRTIALGVCGTDREIVSGHYGRAPPGQKRLVIGHESLGKVEEAPARSGVEAGDLVVGIVRRPDPVPCPACAVGEWDMCRNGRYTERGIKERNGFGSEFFRIEPEFLVKVDSALGIAGVLLEPTSVVAKAWDHTKRIGERARSWQPRSLLITGVGPVGLLAAAS
jgi:glucose 1-dehydrogenase